MLDFINYARGLGARAVVAVSHWHPIATAIALIIGLPLSNIYKIRIGTGSITAIDLEIGDLLFSNLSPIRILRSLGFRDEEILAECNKVVS
jgi:broad specificity phosphatase PhoE